MSLLAAPVLLGISLSVLVGVALGLMGGGGSILMVPILVYVVGLPAHEAVALSLLVVGTTSLVALVAHARAGRLRARTGALFGAASMVGAFVAAKVARFVPSTVLLLLFGALMAVTALAMMRGRRPASGAADGGEPALGSLPLGRIAGQGLGVGAVTGLLGAGGGFLVVPALVLLCRLPMGAAVGTSLLVIVMNASSAFVGHLGHVAIDLRLAAVVTAAAILGSLLGGRLAGRLRDDLLRRGFAWFIIVMAAFILLQEVPRALGAPLDLRRAWPLVLLATAVPAALGALDLTRLARRAAPGAAGAR